MTTLTIDVEEYHRRGYVAGLPVFGAGETPRLTALYWRLRGLLPADERTEAMDWWHAFDRELYEVVSHPAILDCAEAILGPDFYIWGSQFFSKDPHDAKTVPWHQDAYYWPLAPHRTVTVWLAFADSDAQNGAMRVVPGTHKYRLRHSESARGSDVLDMATDESEFRVSDAVHLTLKAGECSLHDDNIVHGSGPNTSDRLRCGLTMRFSAGEVKCDTSVWPFFTTFWMRGTDRWGHNPRSAPPAGLMSEYRQLTPRTGQK